MSQRYNSSLFKRVYCKQEMQEDEVVTTRRHGRSFSFKFCCSRCFSFSTAAATCRGHLRSQQFQAPKWRYSPMSESNVRSMQGLCKGYPPEMLRRRRFVFFLVMQKTVWACLGIFPFPHNFLAHSIHETGIFPYI